VLIVSYISYAADAYSDTLPLQTVNFKRVAIFLFIVVYALWALRDWCEEANSPGDLALMRIYWLTADVVIIICLFVDFVFHVPKSFGYIAVKDWVVFGCLIVYYLLHRTTISLKRRSFVQVYSSYLDSLTGNPITIAGKTADIKNAIRILMQKDSLAVLDFGAGDGRRLWWALDEIDLLKDKPSKGVTVLAYDKLKEWKRFIYAAKATQLVGAGWNLDNTFTNSFSQAKKFASKADLIHASHSVYDTKALRQLSRLIRRSPSGCIFILRGIGSSIFRRMSEGVCLMNPGATNLSFLWSTQFLETLVSSGLSYLLSNHLDSCLVINQPLDDTAKNRLIDFLRALYAGEWSEKMEGLHEAALHHEGLGGNINNQDWMLFFKKT
jgi:hypothetical protein